MASTGVGGCPSGHPALREVLNAIFSLLSTGCAWSASPHDFPPEGTVRDSFHRWRRSGVVVADSR
ncbi:MAG: transposase, partial [Planctomycetaceae bacterium]|nr:transposase [Planctomycetaceae bacterium]